MSSITDFIKKEDPQNGGSDSNSRRVHPKSIQKVDAFSFSDYIEKPKISIEIAQKNRLPVLCNFSELYFKLSNPTYTTVRSIKHKAKLQKLDGTTEEIDIIEGMIGWTHYHHKPLHIVKVIEFQDKKISNIPFEILKRDIEYPGFCLQNHDHFVNELNKITIRSGYAYANNRLETTKRIYFLKKIGGVSSEW